MIEVDVISPQRKVFQIKASSVVLPGMYGEFEVLQGHTPFMSNLKTGILRIKSNLNGGKEEIIMMVSGGFAEVDNDVVSVVCEVATLPKEVDEESEKKLLKDLQMDLKNKENDHIADIENIRVEIERSTTKLKIIQK